MKNRDKQEKWPRKEKHHGKTGLKAYYLRKMIDPWPLRVEMPPNR